jgi:hypothetical protein
MCGRGGRLCCCGKQERENGRIISVNSIKWDYWQNVGAARDEYATAKLALHSMSKRSNGYSHQLEHVNDLRNKFISHSVAFICGESRATPPRMWSALYLSMLDWDKISKDDPRDDAVYSVLKYLLRALEWDRTPIGDNNPLFTCDDFHTYINLSSRLEGERQFITDLWAVVKMLEDMGKVGVRNAEIISRYIVDAAAKSGDDRHMWAYVQQFRYDDDEKDSIEDHIFSNPSEQASQRALLARIRLRSEPDIATSLYPPIKAASTSRLIEAAGRWRNEITARASDGNTLWESDARIAHALVCCELTRRNRITASDLAELIETMSGQHTFHDLTLNTPHGRQHVTNVEELIDAATPHMTR